MKPDFLGDSYDIVRLACLGGEQATIEYWQVTRGGAQRGIVEVIAEVP